MEKELPYAWSAGFIDGEGCISIQKKSEKGRKHYFVTLQIGNTDARPLFALRELFGGTIYHKNRDNPKHEAYWLYVLRRREACNCLNAIYPYLILKKEQAALALAAQSVIEEDAYWRKRTGRATYWPSTLATLKNLSELLKSKHGRQRI